MVTNIDSALKRGANLDKLQNEASSRSSPESLLLTHRHTAAHLLVAAEGFERAARKKWWEKYIKNLKVRCWLLYRYFDNTADGIDSALVTNHTRCDRHSDRRDRCRR